MDVGLQHTERSAAPSRTQENHPPYGKEHVVIVGIVLGMLVMAASLILLARA